MRVVIIINRLALKGLIIVTKDNEKCYFKIQTFSERKKEKKFQSSGKVILLSIQCNLDYDNMDKKDNKTHIPSFELSPKALATALLFILLACSSLVPFSCSTGASPAS